MSNDGPPLFAVTEGDEAVQPSRPKDGQRTRRQSQTPVQRALGLLARREHSRKELVEKLVARGVDPDEVHAAVERLAGEGWQDDRRFAEGVVRNRAAGGYGPLYIRAELARHGLDDVEIAEALDGFEGDWVENAQELVRRRLGSQRQDSPSLTAQRKIADLLMRRGFAGDVVRQVSHLIRSALDVE